MAGPHQPEGPSALDPTAASFTMPQPGSAPSAPKLSGAEIKKQKAAEKAARRAEKVAEKGPPVLPAAPSQRDSQTKPGLPRKLSLSKKDGEVLHHKRTGSTSGKPLPFRVSVPTAEVKERPREEKRIEMFGHLYNREKRTTIAGAGKEIHPAVLALGLQLRDYVICGANARCAAMLLVFKKVIQAYTTPPGTALSRHLTTHLSHQITYLSHSRPLSVSQGNSIRWLKKLISTMDPDLSDFSAKQFLGTT